MCDATIFAARRRTNPARAAIYSLRSAQCPSQADFVSSFQTVTIIMLAMLMPPTISAITPIIRPSVVSESSSVFLACDRSADAVTLHAGAADVRRVGEDTANPFVVA